MHTEEHAQGQDAGFLPSQKLFVVARSLGFRDEGDELPTMFQDIDEDGSGTIGYEEFVSGLMSASVVQSYVLPHSLILKLRRDVLEIVIEASHHCVVPADDSLLNWVHE